MKSRLLLLASLCLLAGCGPTTTASSQSELPSQTDTPSQSETPLESATPSKEESSSEEESQSEEDSTTPIETKTLTITSDNFASTAQIALAHVVPNVDYDNEFTVHPGGSISSDKITGIVKIVTTVFGQYDNLKMYGGNNATPVADYDKSTSGTGANQRTVCTYEFAAPVDAFKLANESNNNVEMIQLDITYAGELLPATVADPYPASGEISIAEALEVGAWQSQKGGTAEGPYTLKGKVKNVGTTEATLYDETGEILLYASTLPEAIKEDYEVTVKGAIKNYYGDIELIDFAVVDYVEATYTINIAASEHGKVTASKTSGIENGEKVTLTVAPDQGYALQSLSINGALATVTDNQVTVTVTKNLNVEALFVEESATQETITKTYTLADYPAGTQYALDEKHELDEYLTIISNKGHFTSELRLYDSSKNQSTATLESAYAILGVTMNVGYAKNTLTVQGSADGTTYEDAGSIEVDSKYADKSLTFIGKGYKHLLLDPDGTGEQVRIKSFTVTFVIG